MLRFFLVLGIGLGSSFSALAKENESKAINHDEEPSYSLGANLGLHWSVVVLGVNATKKVMEQAELVALVNSGEKDLSDEIKQSAIKVREAKVGVTSAQILWRQYFGGTFALSSGLGYRQTKVNANLQSFLFDDLYIKEAITVNSATAYLGLGNYWTVDKMVYGVEWIGFHIPISSNQSTKEEFGPGMTSNDDLAKSRKYVKNFAKSIGKSSSGYLLLGNISLRF